MVVRLISHSSDETFEMGFKFGCALTAPAVLCFFGDLAAGKTTFIKGVAAGASNIDSSLVQSPTFTYLNIYHGSQTIYHFDLYRLSGVREFIDMGFDDFFDENGICCLEWSERIASLLPEKIIRVTLSHEGEDRRTITIEGVK